MPQTESDSSPVGPEQQVYTDNRVYNKRDNGESSTSLSSEEEGAITWNPSFSSQDSSGSESKKDHVHLKKTISLITCCTILIAVTGHLAIFVSPPAIVITSGSVGASLLVWLIGGVINLTQALCFVEMGTIFPKAGGPYTYVMETFGPLAGFLILWGYIILITGPFWAFCGQTAALYLIKPAFPDCNPPEMGVRLLAGWIILSMVVVNCAYMKYVTKAQSFLTSPKILALLIIMIGGAVLLAKGNYDNFTKPFETTTREPGEIAMSILYSVFSYGGWQIMTSLMEEMKNPSRDLPIAVYMAFIIVITKYLLTNIAYYVLLSPKDVAESESVALDFIHRLYPPIGPLIAVFVALTSIGVLNVSIMGHSRLLFAGARLGHTPKLMGMLHSKFMVPWPATFTLCVWALIMLFTGGTLEFMEFIGLYSTYMGLCVTSGLIYFRWKAPHVHRPYKVNVLFAFSQVFINIAIMVLAIYQKPYRMGTGIAILFAGIPVYWLAVLWKEKPDFFKNAIEKITHTAQKILSVRAESKAKEKHVKTKHKHVKTKRKHVKTKSTD